MARTDFTCEGLKTRWHWFFALFAYLGYQSVFGTPEGERTSRAEIIHEMPLFQHIFLQQGYWAP